MDRPAALTSVGLVFPLPGMVWSIKGIMKFLILIAAIMVLTVGAFAQDGAVTAELEFLGGEQPSPLNLRVPNYPGKAKKDFLGGRVTVNVTIGENGKVISADPAEGPYPVCASIETPSVKALRQAADRAASKSVFKPPAGEQIRGRIAYNFPLVVGGMSDTDDDFVLEPIGTTGTDEPDIGDHKARVLPAPEYPRAARAVRAGGPVRVRVLLLEDGSVFSAQAISGHVLLRSASETAACQASFVPTFLDKTPVKVAGIIVYNFVP